MILSSFVARSQTRRSTNGSGGGFAFKGIAVLSIIFAVLSVLTIRTLYLSYLLPTNATSILSLKIIETSSLLLVGALVIGALHIGTILRVIFADGALKRDRQRIRIFRFWRFPLIALPSMQFALVALAWGAIYWSF